MSGYDEYAEDADESQGVELDGPDLAGFYTSQLHDWIPLCPYLSDSGVRLYWIMRALVIEKHGPVRKLTLLQLAYMLPRKPVTPGEKAEPSSLGRIRDLMRMLTRLRLITTPEGEEIKTSSRASAASRPLRIRIHDRPGPGYTGPRNAFALLDSVRAPAAEAAQQAIAREAQQAAQRRAEKAAERTPGEAGQKSNPASPAREAGQKSNPPGQKSNPPGQKSNPDPWDDLQDHDLPLSPSAQSSRSAQDSAPVRPSLQVEDAHAKTPDGGTDGGGGIEGDQEHGPLPAGERPAAADAAPEGSSEETGGSAASMSDVMPVDPTPGVQVLRAIAAEAPQWTITHAKSLKDQGLVVTGMLESGFTAQEIRHALVSQQLPDPLRTTVAAIVSRRLRDLLAMGPASVIPRIPAQSGAPSLFDASGDEDSTYTPDSWAKRREQLEAEASGEGRHRPCAGDDGMCQSLAVPGEDLCAVCSGSERPECVNGCGRNVLMHGTLCIVCDGPEISGECPGHGDIPCGRPVQTEGLCGRCKIEAEMTRTASDSEWEAARNAAVAAAQAEEATPAPL
ncbi:hypothetical protein [Streptomyces sp. NPDC051909]|uniref:hypothetical protein n=1 Tax=Streptomyces sp. NPDC051909 TaxID=3154944 RepID=UPI0034440B86